MHPSPASGPQIPTTYPRTSPVPTGHTHHQGQSPWHTAMSPHAGLPLAVAQPCLQALPQRRRARYVEDLVWHQHQTTQGGAPQRAAAPEAPSSCAGSFGLPWADLSNLHAQSEPHRRHWAPMHYSQTNNLFGVGVAELCHLYIGAWCTYATGYHDFYPIGSVLDLSRHYRLGLRDVCSGATPQVAMTPRGSQRLTSAHQ